MSGLFSQYGFKNEVTYGTPLVVDRFFEPSDPPMIDLSMGRVESPGMQTGLAVQRDDRMVPFREGGGSSPAFDVLTKGWAWWLQHICGTVATSGPTDSNYTHTGTAVPGNLRGKFFTGQVGRLLHGSATVQPFTGHGGKVLSFRLGCDVKGMLVFRPVLDFEDVDDSTGLATASYPSGALNFSFVGGAVTIGGTSVPLTSYEMGVDLKQKNDRRYLRGNALKLEPLESGGGRDVTWQATADFSDLTQRNRFANALASGAHAAIVATFQGPIAHAGATLPAVVMTLPAARFDKHTLSSNLEPTMQTISGVGRTPAAGGSPYTIAVTGPDATP